MTNDLITGAPDRKPLGDRRPILFKGQPVLTTELAALAFYATEKQLQDNFSNNSDRFEEGKHYHKVVGAALSQLKNEPDFIGYVGKNASQLILWTERGIARHAKIIDTDVAWAIFEELEDTYFRVRAEPVRPAANQNLAREARLFFKQAMGIAKVAGLVGNSMLIAANRATRAAVGFDHMAEMGVKYLEAPDNDVLLTATDIGRLLGALSAIRINHLLAENGFQTGERDAKGHAMWLPTEKGIAAGGQMVEVERSNKTGQARQLRWASRIVDVLRDIIEGRAA